MIKRLFRCGSGRSGKYDEVIKCSDKPVRTAMEADKKIIFPQSR
jgi:hypothetical protein